MQPLLPKSPEGGDASAGAHEDAGHVGVSWQSEGGSPGQDTLRQASFVPPDPPLLPTSARWREENLTCLRLAYSEHGVFSKSTVRIGRDSLDLWFLDVASKEIKLKFEPKNVLMSQFRRYRKYGEGKGRQPFGS